jgi:hypothetical protein
MPLLSILLLAGPMMALLFGVITGVATRHAWFGLLAGLLTAPLLLALSPGWLSGLGLQHGLRPYGLVGQLDRQQTHQTPPAVLPVNSHWSVVNGQSYLP